MKDYTLVATHKHSRIRNVKLCSQADYDPLTWLRGAVTFVAGAQPCFDAEPEAVEAAAGQGVDAHADLGSPAAAAVRTARGPLGPLGPAASFWGQ